MRRGMSFLYSRGPKIHRLKTLEPFFEAVCQGFKNFEIRKNDRDFRVGDDLVLREWTGKQYTGRSVCFRITYILSDPAFGTAPGWCVMALGPAAPAKKGKIKDDSAREEWALHLVRAGL